MTLTQDNGIYNEKSSENKLLGSQYTEEEVWVMV